MTWSLPNKAIISSVPRTTLRVRPINGPKVSSQKVVRGILWPLHNFNQENLAQKKMKHFLRMERLKIRYKSKVRWLFSVMTEQARVSRTTPAQRETSIEKNALYVTDLRHPAVKYQSVEIHDHLFGRSRRRTAAAFGKHRAGPRGGGIRGVGGPEGWGDPSYGHSGRH